MQTSNVKVTLGMPVFNVEDYIEKSLICALDQDLDDIEILIINDCCTDNSMDIVAKTKSNHPNGKRIKIVNHEKNLGVAEARNTIINEAHGKYIYFQDSDDFIEKSALSILYQAAEENEAQLTYGSTQILDNGKSRPYISLRKTKLKGKDALANYIYNNIYDIIPNSIWNILILTDFIRKNHLLFPNFRTGEDLLFNELMQPLVTSAVLLPDYTYTYQIRPNSLMKYQKRDVIDIQEAYNSLKYSELQKKYCILLKDKPYYDGKCAKTMKAIFYSACGILKHRHQFNGNISDKEIRNSMKHPEDLFTILSFKHHKIPNLLFWLMGVLPPPTSIALIKLVGKKKGFIK